MDLQNELAELELEASSAMIIQVLSLNMMHSLLKTPLTSRLVCEGNKRERKTDLKTSEIRVMMLSHHCLRNFRNGSSKSTCPMSFRAMVMNRA